MFWLFLCFVIMVQSRKLQQEDALSNFLKIEAHSLRGFNQGGVFTVTSDLECAVKCTEDTQCESFDVELPLCYISHSSRHSNPQDFAEYGPESSYYEWNTKVFMPEVYPAPSSYGSSVLVTFVSATRNATIH